MRPLSSTCQLLARLGSTSKVRPLVLVRPSKIILVIAVVEVSFAKIGLNERGSEVTERINLPPYRLLIESSSLNAHFKVGIKKTKTRIAAHTISRLILGIFLEWLLCR